MFGVLEVAKKERLNPKAGVWMSKGARPRTLLSPVTPVRPLGAHSTHGHQQGLQLRHHRLPRAPEARRRLPTQAQRDRDRRVEAMLRAGWTYRDVARQLGCSMGAVQRSVGRIRARKMGQRNGFDE